MLHRTANTVTATRDEIRNVEVPNPTHTFRPVPYMDLITGVENRLAAHGLGVRDEQFLLAREGKQLFGMFLLDRNWGGGSAATGGQLMVGLRSSYDHSLAPAGAGGLQVTACENGLFYGDVQFRRKQTTFARRDIPMLIEQLVAGMLGVSAQAEAQVDVLRGRNLDQPEADNVIMESVRRRILPASRVGEVDREYRTPSIMEFDEESMNAWRLHNAFTFGTTRRDNPAMQMKRTVALQSLFTDVLHV